MDIQAGNKGHKAIGNVDKDTNTVPVEMSSSIRKPLVIPAEMPESSARDGNIESGSGHYTKAHPAQPTIEPRPISRYAQQGLPTLTDSFSQAVDIYERSVQAGSFSFFRLTRPHIDARSGSG